MGYVLFLSYPYGDVMDRNENGFSQNELWLMSFRELVVWLSRLITDSFGQEQIYNEIFSRTQKYEYQGKT